MELEKKEIKRTVASGPGIPNKEGENPETRKIRLDRQYLGNPFITEGSVFCFSLLDIIQGPIEINNYKIIALDVYKKNGVLYGATTGDEDNLFFMDKKKIIVNIGKIQNKKINKNSISIAENSFLYFAASENNNTIIFKHDVDTDYIDNYPLSYFGSIEQTKASIENEIFVESLFNKWDGNIYYLSESGKLFRFDINKENFEMILELEDKSLKTFCCDSEGNIFGSLYGGEIFRFNITEKKMYKTGENVPSQKGREYLAGVRKLIIKNNIIYGCTSQDNYLFKYDINKNKVFNFGRPDENYDLRSIIVEKNNLIFGTTTTRGKGLGHLFLFDENGFKDLGNIVGHCPTLGWSHEPTIMVLGNDGEIFIADDDNRSKLFIYFPKFY